MSFPDVVELRRLNKFGIPAPIHSKLKTVLLVKRGVSRDDLVDSIVRWLLPIQQQVWAPLYWTRGPQRFEHNAQADALSRLSSFFQLHQDSWGVSDYYPTAAHGKLISDLLRTQYSSLPLDRDQIMVDIERFQYSTMVIANANGTRVSYTEVMGFAGCPPCTFHFFMCCGMGVNKLAPSLLAHMLNGSLTVAHSAPWRSLLSQRSQITVLTQSGSLWLRTFFETLIFAIIFTCKSSTQMMP